MVYMAQLVLVNVALIAVDRDTGSRLEEYIIDNIPSPDLCNLESFTSDTKEHHAGTHSAFACTLLPLPRGHSIHYSGHGI